VRARVEIEYVHTNVKLREFGIMFFKEDVGECGVVLQDFGDLQSKSIRGRRRQLCIHVFLHHTFEKSQCCLVSNTLCVEVQHHIARKQQLLRVDLFVFHGILHEPNEVGQIIRNHRKRSRV